VSRGLVTLLPIGSPFAVAFQDFVIMQDFGWRAVELEIILRERGNRLQVVETLVDCDDDTVLLKVKRLGDGNVCHTGERTCFYRTLANDSRTDG